MQYPVYIYPRSLVRTDGHAAWKDRFVQISSQSRNAESWLFGCMITALPHPLTLTSDSTRVFDLRGKNADSVEIRLGEEFFGGVDQRDPSTIPNAIANWRTVENKNAYQTQQRVSDAKGWGLNMWFSFDVTANNLDGAPVETKGLTRLSYNYSVIEPIFFAPYKWTMAHEIGHQFTLQHIDDDRHPEVWSGNNVMRGDPTRQDAGSSSRPSGSWKDGQPYDIIPANTQCYQMVEWGKTAGFFEAPIPFFKAP